MNGTEFPVVPAPGDPSTATVADVPQAASYLVMYNGLGNTVKQDEWAFDLPAVQPYVANTFADRVNPMAAFGTTPELTMRHLCGIIRISVTGDASVASLSLTGNDGEPLSGYLLLSTDDLIGGNYAGSTNHGYMTYPSIRMECSPAVTLDPVVPTNFYFVVPAGTYAKGFNVAMTDKDGTTAIQSTTKSTTVDRAGITAMEPFAFVPTPDVTLSVKGATHSTISYSVEAKAGASIRTLVVSQLMWDYYLNENAYYIEHPDELPMQILTQLGTTVSVDDSGVYCVETSQARGMNGITAITAASSYKILASYADGEASIGNVSQQDVRTADPTGTAPELNVTRVPETFRPYATITFRIKTTDAANIRRAIYSRSSYDQLAGQYTDAELIARDGTALSDAMVANANGEGTLIAYRCAPASSFVLLVSASGEGGMETLEKAEGSTPAYLDPDASWTVVSEKATLNCGLFYPFGISKLEIPNLTVEKMSSGDVFRIRDPFSTTRTPLLAEANLSDKAGGPYYLVIDARNPDAVLLEDFVNDSGLESTRYGLSFIRVVSLPLIANVSPDDYPYGTYDADQGIIYLNRPGLSCDQGLFPTQESTTLHLNLPKTGGFTTEDFTIGDPVSW